MARACLLGSILSLACGTEEIPGAKEAGADRRAQEAWRAALADTEQWLEASGIPGATLAAVVDGKVRFEGGVGVRSLGATDPMTTQTRMGWLSISKMHTAAAAMRLVEAGALDLDEPVVQRVPELHLEGGADASGITMRHLLSHTSGIGSTVAFYDGICDDSLGEVWSSLETPLWAPAGAVFVYNNFAAYSLAALVIERAAGKPFDAAVEQLVFEPAGMTTATYDPHEVFLAEHADGTTKMEGVPVSQPVQEGWYTCPVEPGPGGMMATAGDVARMLAVHASGGAPLLSAASEAAMRDQVDTHETPDGESRYGLGLYRSVHRGTEVLGAWAWGGGFRGQALIVPALRWAFVVGVNGDWAAPSELAYGAFDRFFPDLPRTEPDFRTPADSWSRYEGQYADTHALGSVTVELRGDELYVRRALGAEWKLTQVSGDYFEYVAGDGSRLGVQFVAEAGCTQTAWLATFGIGASSSWPEAPLGIAHRDAC